MTDRERLLGAEASRRWMRILLGFAAGVLALLSIAMGVALIVTRSLDLQTGLYACGTLGASAALIAFSRHMLGPFEH
ncbi:MAG: hypothetical protein M3320_05055 [Actinomycetota bacterium]|nr:hypothetical protein [Actinomycetota bacterium]MDQ5808026.1 hypothetical protein [Actinomycetota bacterium]